MKIEEITLIATQIMGWNLWSKDNPDDETQYRIRTNTVTDIDVETGDRDLVSTDQEFCIGRPNENWWKIWNPFDSIEHCIEVFYKLHSIGICVNILPQLHSTTTPSGFRIWCAEQNIEVFDSHLQTAICKAALKVIRVQEICDTIVKDGEHLMISKKASENERT